MLREIADGRVGDLLLGAPEIGDLFSNAKSSPQRCR